MTADLALWFEVVRWLDDEAQLLDEGRLEEWLDLLNDDVQYSMPVRLTRERGTGQDSHAGAPHFLDNARTLRLRIERLKTEFAWAEDPPSRTRRFVTNVRPHAVGDGGVEVRSYLLLYRNRGEDSGAELLSAERHDALRRTEAGLRLARREIRVDQSTLGIRNLALIL
jgi:3-phenylpropionate/cinnamic acid dioxygenase small subunit